MSKYHFVYELIDGKTVLEYDTDCEPPQIGYIVQFHLITNDEDANRYRVEDIYYAPTTENHVDIDIELSVDK